MIVKLLKDNGWVLRRIANVCTIPALGVYQLSENVKLEGSEKYL